MSYIRILRILFGAQFFAGVACAAIGIESRPELIGYPEVVAYSSAETGVDVTSWTMTQAADGVLYFGCNGLVTFDGERWQANELKGSYALRGLDWSPDGRLWVAAHNELGWFTREHDGKWTFHSLKSKLPKNEQALGEVWYAFSNGPGAEFVGTHAIYHWNGETFQVWSMPGPRRITAMRAGNSLYVHHSLSGLFKIEHDVLRKVIGSDVLGDCAVVSVKEVESGLLLATSKGLFRWDGASLQPFATEASDYIKQNVLTSVAYPANGGLVLGTYRGGIVMVDAAGNLTRILAEHDGLPTKAIYFVAIDRDGALWATSNTHIFRIGINSGTAIFDSRAGLPAQPIRSIAETSDTIFAAAENGAYEIPRFGRDFVPAPSLKFYLTSMTGSGNGLLVTEMHSVKRVSAGQTTLLYHSPEPVYVATESKIDPKMILVGEAGRIIAVDESNNSRVLVDNIPDIVTSIAEDRRGLLWFGTYSKGVFVATPSTTGTAEPKRTPLLTGLVSETESTFVASSVHGDVLVIGATSGWILGASDRSKFLPISGYPKRGASAVTNLGADGNLWLVCSGSKTQPALVGRVTVHDGKAHWKSHFVGGMAAIGTPQSIYAETNSSGSQALWIGGTRGLLRNDISGGPVAMIPRAPLLKTSAYSENSAIPLPITAPLAYSTRAITFEFAEPDFSLRSAVRLESKIDGIDHEWIPADQTSRRELSAVRDGDYVFHVRAVAATGAKSETTSFHFRVLPPWWRTVPALGGFALALFPIGFGIYSLRVRQLRRRNEELEEKVQQRTEQLALASAAKTQFVANMSHDIRNPLNGIVGLALALEDTRLDAQQREMISTLRECTSYLSTLVDDVLDFASIEAGRIELRNAPFSPAELLRSVVATLKAEAATRGASLSMEVDPALPPLIAGDAGRIQQILVNYVSNALKYAGGRIHLSAAAPLQAAGEIEFSVADEGAGISEADQAALFTKFHRLHGARQSEIKGTGIGLASCRLLADFMGGSVGVASKPGHGARFYLRLPLTVAEAPVAVAAGALPNMSSVLLVEDADYNAWAASAVLAKLGLSCERARNGAEAVRMFNAKRYNLVLLDRNLPDMDGLEVARQIRGLEEDGPRAILLAVTAYCTAQDRALCLDAGMDAFVGKPLTPNKLRKVLVAAGRRLLTAATMHVSPDVAAPAIDVSLLEYISDGSEQGLADQVERFIASLAEGQARLAQATSSRDFKSLGEAAHFLLSQGKLVGCATLEEAALTLERAAKSRDAFAFGEMEQRVHREISAVTAAMRRHHPAGQST